MLTKMLKSLICSLSQYITMMDIHVVDMLVTTTKTNPDFQTVDGFPSEPKKYFLIIC